MAKELFLEIGSEEIPSGFIKPALADMAELAAKALGDARIYFGSIKTYGTPRRLVLVASDVAERQEDVIVENQGPAKKVAFEESGKPTRAMLGFARGQGVDPEKLEVRETPKGAYLFAVKEKKGVDTVQLLPAILEGLVSSIHFKKSMRWRALDIAFARPVHWITALFGGRVVSCTFGDLQSSDVSRGHRFLAPEEFRVDSFEDYQKKCQDSFVMIDPDKRKEAIKKGILEAAKNAGGKLIEDDGLLDEVANLVEYPVVLRGNFDKEYLKLPKDIVVNAMREHQRYFSVVNENGKLLPSFITVSNTKARDMNIVKDGNERVLRARLSDAAFYYYEDLKAPLDAMVDSLKKVVFQAKLGSSYEKVERFKALAGFLADELNPEKKEKVLRAAHLCKGDLVSGVVGEFPSLQGVMGRDYALKAGEDVEVAEAIFEHYLPRNADDILPKSDIGAIVSIADKMDTICGCIGVGLTPTGASDPYALRRQAIGIINIIVDKGYGFSLVKAIDKSIEISQDKLIKKADEVKTTVLDFFKTRLMGILASKGYPHDVADSVLSIRLDDILDSVEVVKALTHLKERPDFEPLAVAFKRVVNITKDFNGKTVDESLFSEDSEKRLSSSCKAISVEVFSLAEKGRYREALLKAAEIRPYVDSFFDDVMVMVDDVKIRENRLSLLKDVSALFTRFADFSIIVAGIN